MRTEHYIAPTKAPSVAENADMLAVMQRLAKVAPAASAVKGLSAEEPAQNG